ncbi:DUF427 domain-containing protein [Rhizobium sp. CG5]|uniref:DUF427 domain-containing protein n=1 Tax=Rhizobium sp. CG5 TaxID=2726076 RepID=UPI002033A006|nr:DUF427 domain-containing protein [Rhizobium sp. CG5]MCM2477682.1 DUF427 domain-containing protein [Rhizobium sp. CG5]
MSLAYRSTAVPAVLIEPTHRRIRLLHGETVLADSERAIVVYENDGHPVYYLPAGDFRPGVLTPGERTEASERLGERRYHDVLGVGAAKAWSHDGAAIGLPDLAGYVTVEWSAARWFEEDEEIFRHPRNVYRRVDTIASSRLVEGFVAGQLVARTRRAIFLFETGHRTRYYFRREDVIAGSLVPSELHTYCPYKGEASYFHWEIDDRRYDNIVWFYPEPLPESSRIAGLVAFYEEKIEAIRVSASEPRP